MTPCYYDEAILIWVCRGSSVVERSPEEAGVGGSIPSRGTKKNESVRPIHSFPIFAVIERRN